MHYHLSFLGAATLLPLNALAYNSLNFINNCPHNLYFWVVPPHATETNANNIIVPGNGGSITHQMLDWEGKGGVSVKIRDLPYYIVGPAGILQAEYKVERATSSIWYDFSAIDCDGNAGQDSPSYCPFKKGGVRMWVPGADQEVCPVAQCLPDGTCRNTYLEHGSWEGEPSYRCNIGWDVVFETCTHGSVEKTWCPEDEQEYLPPPPEEWTPPVGPSQYPDDWTFAPPEEAAQSLSEPEYAPSTLEDAPLLLSPTSVAAPSPTYTRPKPPLPSIITRSSASPSSTRFRLSPQ